MQVQVSNQGVMAMPVAPMPPRLAPQWRCGTVTSLIFALLSILFLITCLGLKDTMYADYYGLSVTFKVQFGLFGSGEACSGGTCADVDTDQLTCGQVSGVRAGAAFFIMALLLCFALVATNIIELATSSELLPHMTVIVSGTAFVFTNIAHLCLAFVRANAKYSATSCPGTIPGLERYGVGGSWVCGIFATIFLGFGFIIYMARRYNDCCGGCCCDVPLIQPMPTAEVVVQVQTYPQGGAYPQQQPQAQYYAPQQQGGYPPQQQVYQAQPQQQYQQQYPPQDPQQQGGGYPQQQQQPGAYPPPQQQGYSDGPVKGV